MSKKQHVIGDEQPHSDFAYLQQDGDYSISARKKWAARLREIQLKNAVVLIRLGLKDLAARLIKCIASEQGQDDIDNIRFYVAANRCGNRVCVFCSRRVTKRKCRRYIPKIDRFIDAGLLLTGITLTVPSVPYLEWEHYTCLFAWFNTLIHSELLTENVVGAIAKADLKFNASRGEYQLHLHCVLIHRADLPSPYEFRKLWYKITSPGLNWRETSDLPEVENRSIKIDPITCDETDPLSTQRKLTKAVSYISKDTVIDESEAYGRFVEVTYGQKLIRSYGKARKDKSRNLTVPYLDKGEHKTACERAKASEQRRCTVALAEHIVQDRIIVEATGGWPEAPQVSLGGEDSLLSDGQKRLMWLRSELEKEREQEHREREIGRVRPIAQCPECGGIMLADESACRDCHENARMREATEKIARTRTS